ncbi:para-aminobenzoate synthetase component 1 [Mucilaginibacter gracilis]|uniref:Para-aminobenzoate synthetase component 1 n=1 Tax=Mucilaginibacter gracilis TaxID=423350 RepID=A0A495J1S9_9SPHI|nr:anthranilate synthase component I family protein [Mucilaginibacter gracilis]RKR82591.1 para-aminobenzoate synthetase component 1 [Mucilaginibacter gracilis]
MTLKHQTDINLFKQKALQWANGFDVAICLNSNNFTDRYSKFEILIAAGAKHELKCDEGSAFEQLDAFREKHKDWVLGALTYDLKNEIENLSSANTDKILFPGLYFFVPQHIIIVRGDEIEVVSDDQYILNVINGQIISYDIAEINLKLQSRFSRDEYIETVKTIQQHIIRGDIYETNFCQEFYAEEVTLEPLALFNHLNKISPAPFGCYFKLYDKYIISASPERFLAKRNDKLISQPIKGTAKRSSNKIEDEVLKQSLKEHPKEQQENVMIVDLVRNDLTRSAKPGTVKVDELFGIYTFKQVHQMISTVVCQKDEALSDVQVIKNTFPMGSMTGAPKFSAMQLMENYERTKRGLYSGAIGYFSPDGDFDFNVVIRTILYNLANQYLSFEVGSAITHNADAEYEYEECLLKAKAILQVLGQH